MEDHKVFCGWKHGAQVRENVGGIFHTIAEHDPAYKNKRKWMHTPDTWLHPASLPTGSPSSNKEAVTPRMNTADSLQRRKEGSCVGEADRHETVWGRLNQGGL